MLIPAGFAVAESIGVGGQCTAVSRSSSLTWWCYAIDKYDRAGVGPRDKSSTNGMALDGNMDYHTCVNAKLSRYHGIIL